jgi:hypothetical protein
MDSTTKEGAKKFQMHARNMQFSLAIHKVEKHNGLCIKEGYILFKEGYILFKEGYILFKPSFILAM